MPLSRRSPVALLRGAAVALALGTAPPLSAQEAPPFGEVVAVCGVTGKALGTRIDRRPETGRAAWELYDTAPGQTGPRVFHVTGFSDGCARRLTAALAMFGSVELYELVHFSGLVAPGGAETDRAYAALRAGPCGSAQGPCPGSGLRRLARETAFLSVFAQKGATEHLELLLSGGALAAAAHK